MKRIIWVIALWLALTVVVVPLAGAQATADIEILDQKIDSFFRDRITTEISAEGSAEITNVEFYYRVTGQRATSRNVADFEPGKTVEAQFTINQRETYFPPGTELEYWWKLTDADGNSLKTDPEQYLYLDDRFDFKTLSNERLTLYWYRGGRSFGEALFDQANRGLNQLEENVGVAIEQPVKIFIYGDHQDLINSIAVGAQEWTGGQAFTDFGVVVIGVEPDSLDWGMRAMTHELTHLIIHQATTNPYSDLPRWLDEGLAVYNEDPEQLDEQFRESFGKAVASDSLFTLQTLSSTFPADPDAAGLAYGQSGAVVGFIVNTYGTEAMHQLLDIFSEGTLTDDALEEALGENTRSLDNAFRVSLGLEPLPDSSEQAAEPEAETEQPQANQAEAEQPEAETEQAEAQPATPESSSVDNAAETESAAEAEAPAEPRRRGIFGCLSGLLPLVALGFVYTQRAHTRRRL